MTRLNIRVALIVGWFFLCLVIPQLDQERTIHPFFNWKLFAPQNGKKFKYQLKITKCEGANYDPALDVLTQAKFKAGELKFPYLFRIESIVSFVEQGKLDLAKESLRRVIKNTLAGYNKCEFVLYKGESYDSSGKWHVEPLVWNPIEETRIEN